MNLISDKFELKDLPERRQRRQRRRRWELWKLLKLSPLTTYLLPSHLLVYGKAATNYNKIVISFNLSAAAERTKFLFMFCHLVVLGSWFCRLPPAPLPFCSRNFFLLASVSVRHCRVPVPVPLAPSTPSPSFWNTASEACTWLLLGRVEGRMQRCIYRVIPAASCHLAILPFWPAGTVATVGIDHISVSAESRVDKRLGHFERLSATSCPFTCHNDAIN